MQYIVLRKLSEAAYIPLVGKSHLHVAMVFLQEKNVRPWKILFQPFDGCLFYIAQNIHVKHHQLGILRFFQTEIKVVDHLNLMLPKPGKQAQIGPGFKRVVA